MRARPHCWLPRALLFSARRLSLPTNRITMFYNYAAPGRISYDALVIKNCFCSIAFLGQRKSLWLVSPSSKRLAAWVKLRCCLCSLAHARWINTHRWRPKGVRRPDGTAFFWWKLIWYGAYYLNSLECRSTYGLCALYRFWSVHLYGPSSLENFRNVHLYIVHVEQRTRGSDVDDRDDAFWTLFTCTVP